MDKQLVDFQYEGRTASANSWLGSKCGFGGDAKICTFIPALVVAKQDSFSFVRTCAKPRNVIVSPTLRPTELVECMDEAYRG